VHWREKGYCTAQDWRQFCSGTVPLARFPRFVYTSADTLVVPVEAYHAAQTPLSVQPSYTIVDDSQHVLSTGPLSDTGTLPVGKNLPLGTVCFPLSNIKEPAKLTLSVSLTPQVRNQWDFWVYPQQEHVADADGIYIADSLDTRARKLLRRGGKVLLTAAGHVMLGSDVKQTYLPVLWNTSWFKMRPPHTTGAYIDTSHPLFRYGFPTDEWSNLNWWELLNRAQVMNLVELPAEYQSPVQPIDTWHVSRKLGMIVEARVGRGRLLMTTMDISRDLDRRVVARQMRTAILRYMQSSDFQPTMILPEATVSHFFTSQAPPVNMFTNDSPDELKPKLK
jgi:hypothetical protein